MPAGGHVFLMDQICISLSYPAILKSVGYYVIPSCQKIAFERLYIRLSVSASFSLSAGSFFNHFSSNML